ncbi:MAG TPA: undecaprenyl-diphosphate phosphatase [Spirochaetota bacterium]|nr:undecaprenyl-diphosphate phosphatase [Spirochaetota bacterium]HPI87762.1 undecaprenyl-diphosphate phosphatase [Spirochaetota bacterium]
MHNLFLALMALGLVQGIAEFLPISSSGHLVIVEQIPFMQNILLEGGGSNLLVNVALHVATLLAVIVYLRKDIFYLISGSVKGIRNGDYFTNESKIIVYIAVAAVPAVCIGLLFNDFFENLYSSSTPVFAMLIINGIILISTKKIPLKSRQLYETGFVRSLIIGFFQALAIVPGISRSGITIVGGLLNGIKPEETARFSFLMAIPIIAGAGLVEGVKLGQGPISGEIMLPLAVSMLVTFCFSIISIRVLFILVKQIKLDYFGYYSMALGIGGLVKIYFF